LIPAYNAEKWIGETIQSALDQTWPEKEVIIVDDGSFDATLRIARGFESTSVKVITQENRGASAARNRALSLAQGDYIQWLDADDLLAPNKVSLQLRYAEGGAESRILLSSSFGEFYSRQANAKFVPTSLWRDLKPVEWLLTKFSENLWVNPAVWLVSRRLTELGGPWDERLSLDDDGEYFTRIIGACERIMFVPEARTYYRRANVGSLSRSVSERACKSLFLSLTLCIGHLRSLEDSERTRRACLRLLGMWLPLYYPEEEELLEKFQVLARELGGTLLPPKVSWKYFPIKKIFGWKVAKKVMSNWRQVKLLAYRNWDRLLYNIENKGNKLEG
jgi:glycosyltransferase involved in cell wall biosynthesis